MTKWEVCLITHYGDDDPDKVRAKVEYSMGSTRVFQGKEAGLPVLLAAHHNEGWDFVASSHTNVGPMTLWVLRRPIREDAS